MKPTVSCTQRQYRYPDLRSQYEKNQDRMEEVNIPVNRKQRKNVRYIR